MAKYPVTKLQCHTLTFTFDGDPIFDYNRSWFDAALSAVYEGVWLRSIEYSEIESRLLQLDYLPDQVHDEGIDRHHRDPWRKGPWIVPVPTVKNVKTEKHVDKKLSKERQQIKDDIFDLDTKHPYYSHPYAGPESTACFRRRVEKLEKEYEIVLARLNELTEEVRTRIHGVKIERRPTSELEKISDDLSEKLTARFDEVWRDEDADKKEATEEDDELIDMFINDEDPEAMEAANALLEEEIEADLEAQRPKKTEIVIDLKCYGKPDNRSMLEMSKMVRSVRMKGLRIRGTKIVTTPRGYRKMQLVCVLVDNLLKPHQVVDRFKAIHFPIKSAEIILYNKLDYNSMTRPVIDK